MPRTGNKIQAPQVEKIILVFLSLLLLSCLVALGIRMERSRTKLAPAAQTVTR